MMDDILLDIKDMGYYYSIFSKEKKYNRICVSVSGKRKPILRKDIDGVIVTLNKLESYLESVGIKIYKIELNMRSGSSSYGVNNSSLSKNLFTGGTPIYMDWSRRIYFQLAKSKNLYLLV